MTSIDMSGLPDFSGVAEKVQQAAAGLKKAGAGIQETGRRVNSVWTKGGLRQFYTAPEAEKVLAAMGPVQAEGDTVGSQTATVVSALEAFAAEVAKIQQQLTILKADIADFNGDVMGDPDAMEDDATRDRYNSLINRMNAWGVTAFQRAERDCANKINALTGGPHYVPGEFGDDHGKLPPGYQRYGWARLPDGARVPWGSTVKEPDPWWERFAKGAGKAAWGLVTGTFSLVDFTNTETFLASWDGLLKLGYGSSPVILAASAIRGDGRAKEGLEAWKALGKDFVGWDEHAKGNHAGAFGATAVNVATLGPITKLLKAGELGKGGAAARAAGHIPGFTGLANVGRNIITGIQTKLDSLRGTKAPQVIDPASIRFHLPEDSPAARRPAADERPHSPEDGGATRLNPHKPAPTVGDLKRRLDDLHHGAEGPKDIREVPDARRPRSRGSADEPDQGTQSKNGGSQDDVAGTRRDSGSREPQGGREPESAPNERPADPREKSGPGKDDAQADRRNQHDTDDQTPSKHDEGDAGAGGQGPHQPGRDGAGHGENNSSDGDSPDPEVAAKLDRADRLEAALRDGGLSDDDIARLRGPEPREGADWQRLASAIAQGFSSKVKDTLHPAAVRFAMDGAADPREFAHRYEYFKARYDEYRRYLKEHDPRGETHKGQSRALAAAEWVLNEDLNSHLNNDVAAARRARPHTHATLDPELTGRSLEQSVRAHADDIGMGSDTSAAYHARKHYHEVGVSAQSGHVVDDYLKSAERTIGQGALVKDELSSSGSRQMVFHREVIGADGNPRTVEAVVYVKPNGETVLATYGEPKAVR
ncbi:hypothetical protein ABZ801_00710 [Actinomadura sp. NPDC047616]|uniref:hypothetical protein n=1 Tax=Actinomadura sp. NPDC047616 TaxID=3155914 RepID=UPI0033F5F7A5